MALHEPVELPKLLRNAETLDLFFDGLRQHYVEAFASGRAKVWCECAHRLIDLIECSDTPPFERRR